MKEFKDKVAVITGAASGIGRGIAERCVLEGMKVVLADISTSALLKTETDLKALGGRVASVQTDVAKRGEVEALALRTLEMFGAVHLLVNNAGVYAGMSPWESTWNDWDWVVGVNLWGVIHGVKIFTPLMLAQNTQCHIVNTSSVAGLVAGHPSAPYSLTKHAVVALSENLHLSLQQRNALVKVSVLCPCIIATDIMNCERHRPAELRNEPVEASPEMQAALDFLNAAVEAGISPMECADQVFKAMREERFYILTDLQWLPVVQSRVDNLLRLKNPEDTMDVIINLCTPAG
jgi:NAD(P)-dependent dehydrogenase (short-subunit alcohol dehydrogenase family)